jgi:hypothetical protein
MDPLGLKASLRKRMAETDDAPAAPAAAASAPSQAQFFKGPKPDAAARQQKLIEALRKRGY